MLLSLVLLCSIAMVSTSCNKDKTKQKPEIEAGKMIIGEKTMDIKTSEAVKYGNRNAIVLASKEMTAAENNGICILFNGDITPGSYKFEGKTKASGPQVVAVEKFNMGELPALMDGDTVFFGNYYFWLSGSLTITEDENGTYTILLTQSSCANGIQLSLNFSGTLTHYTYPVTTDNKFFIGDSPSPIGLATLSNLGLFDTLNHGAGAKSLLFMSTNHKKAFIINLLEFGSPSGLVGEYHFTPLGPLGNPNLIVATAFDLGTLTPETAYTATSGRLVISKDDVSGLWTIDIENAHLMNLEHPGWMNTTGSLHYVGPLFGLEN